MFRRAQRIHIDGNILLLLASHAFNVRKKAAAF
jgi:hypothetical protein